MSGLNVVVRGRGSGRWWQSGAPIAAAIDALGVDFGVADLGAWFAGLTAGSHELLAGDPRAPSAVMVSIGPTARLQVSLFGAELDARRAALPGALRDVLTRTFDVFVAAGVEVLEVQVWAAKVTFVRGRPPRVYPGLAPDGAGAVVVQGFDRGAPRDADAQRVLDHLATASLPPRARRIEHGRLVLIEWVPSLEDPAAALEERDAWLRDQDLPYTGASGYDEHGDRHVGPWVTGVAIEPLTLYLSGVRRGLKAVVPTPDGELDEGAVVAVRDALRAGRLPTGEPLDGVTFIAPTREAAVAVLPAAQRFGADTVVYPDPRNRGMYWDVDPD